RRPGGLPGEGGRRPGGLPGEGGRRPGGLPPTSVPPWPGSLPAPAPARVHQPPLAAEVVDPTGAPVRVSGRGLLSAPPARVAVAGEGPRPVRAWAGPWPIDERWWDPARHRRRARLQAVTDVGTAHLFAIEGGRWW